MNNCFIVLGMHRSGTSMIAQLLSKLGVNMGVRFREPDVHNPDGYFEDLDWRDLNHDILQAAGGTWYEPPVINDILKIAFKHRIEALVAARSGSIWGAKDPRFCLTLPVIAPYLENPFYILVNRNAVDIVKSLKKRAELRGYSETDAHWHALVTQYYLSAARFLQRDHSGQLYIINYDRLIDDPNGQVAGLAITTGLQGDICKAAGIIRTQ